MDERRFYEGYFLNLRVKEQELEKQFNRIERLRKEILYLQAPEVGLFVGMGKGAEVGAGRGKVVGLDLPLSQLAINKKQHPQNIYICGDGRKLPFRNSLFDYVVCSEVIEHIRERAVVLREFWRILKPGGTLILSTPNWWSMYGIFRGAYQMLFHKEVHADDQPLDQWTTPPSLKREISPWFSVQKVRGSWYFPPTGKGEFQLFPRLWARFFRLLNPLDFVLGEVLPYFGHSLWIVAQPKKYPAAVKNKDAASPLQFLGVRTFLYLWLLFFTAYAFFRGGILKTVCFYIQKITR